MNAIFKNLCEAKLAAQLIMKTVYIFSSDFHLSLTPCVCRGEEYLIIQLVLTPAHQLFGFYFEVHSYP